MEAKRAEFDPKADKDDKCPDIVLLPVPFQQQPNIPHSDKNRDTGLSFQSQRHILDILDRLFLSDNRDRIEESP